MRAWRLHGFDVAPRSLTANHLGLVQADHRFSERVVVRIADAPDRSLDAGVGQALGVSNSEQYASHEYRAAHRSRPLASMSRRADCWDNAVAESFFSTLKLEHAYESAWQRRADARADVFGYLEVF